MAEFIPLPTFSGEEYINLVKQPNDYLLHEYFRLDGPSGITRLGFPFTLSICKSFNNFQMRAHLHGRPNYSEFYDENHPAGGLMVTEKIF